MTQLKKIKVRSSLRFLFVGVLVLTICKVDAQFTNGNIVVLQVGDGVQALANTGNSLFLKEFTPAGAPGISVTIPDNGSNACITSGAATSEGQITRSSDGTAILVPGYNTNVPFSSSLASSSSFTVPRIITQVDGCANITLAGSSTTFFNGNNIRSATANITTNNYWASGANTGMCYYGTGTPAVMSTTVTNERVVHIYNGNLMFSTGSGTQGVYQISGQPITGANAAIAVVTNAGGSPYGFAIDAAATILYMADDRPFANTSVSQGGIEKYTWNGSAWVFQYTLQCGVGTFGARGLAVDFSGANPILYASTTEGSSNRLIKITDVGAASGSSALVLATSPANTVYRGVAFSPIGAPNITSISSTTPVCAGTTLNLTVTATGTPALNYSWTGPNSFSSNQQNPIITNVTVAEGGIYSVTVTNACGTITQTTSVIVNPSPTGTLVSTTNDLCNGNNNGAATVSASGGNPGYTYSWTPSGGNATTASSLTAGNYTCTITDANTCSTTVTAIITQPSALITLFQGQTDVSCNGGNNGSASIAVTGGTPAYTYSWTPFGGTAALASSLTAGSYTCNITDAQGCTLTQTVTIAQPPALSATNSQTNVSCNGGNTGSAAVIVSGGTPAYTYSWTPSGGTNATASGLTSGNYTCTITDGNSCTLTQLFNITEPTALAVSTAQTNVSCNGGNTGSATVTISGGTPGYTYAWTPSGGNAATASSLAAGNYTCTVTDANGCILTQPFNITEPTALTATTSQVNVSCSNGNSGSATVVVSGGSPAYMYAWTPSGGNTATASSLGVGNDTCIITDGNGCQLTETFTITQPSTLSATSSQTNILCNGGNNGSATVTASGGSPAYTYAWTPSGGNAATASSLIAGSYTCTITDANGCSITQLFNITQPTALSLTSSQTNVSCNGGNTGSATVTVSGGTPAYTYAWTPSGGNAATASTLNAGSYMCTVTDANGCTLTQPFNITEPTALTATTSQVNVTCSSGNSGSATVVVSGGTASYSYAWTPTGGNAATASSLAAGNYTCTITDANGCTLTQLFNITQPTAITATSTLTTILCNGGNTGSATVTASGGTPSYTYAWTPAGGNASTASNLTAGNYTCTITDANGCTLTQLVNITQPTAISLTVSSSPACGLNNGSASANASGGTSPFTYSWSPTSGTTSSLTGLSTGNYSCTITDANGCTQSGNVNVVTNTNPTASVSPGVTIQVGTTTTLTALGGGNYFWSPSGDLSCNNCASPIASPIQTTIYCVTVTDANSCSDTACTTVAVDQSCPQLFVPNAFSPNGDNENDMLCIYGTQCIMTMHFAIYDRWGEKVFETDKPSDCWDGTFGGKQLDPAVYYYTLDATYYNTKQINQKGSITLLR